MKFYREFNCVVCGAKAIDRSPAQKRMYCSEQCAWDQFRRNRGIGVNAKTPPCIHNQEVQCAVHKCSTCGWNPKVEQRRKEALAYG